MYAHELQMPIGPQALEDAEEPMPSCLATLKDRGTLDQIMLGSAVSNTFPESASV